MECCYGKEENFLNKTKKYTLIFVIICFLFIGGVSIYRACFVEDQTSKPVVTNKTNEVQQDKTVSKQEKKSKEEKETQKEEQKEKEEQKKKEEQSDKTSQKKEKTSTQQKKQTSSAAQSQATSQQKETQTSPSSSQEVAQDNKDKDADVQEDIASVNVTIKGVDGTMAQDHVEYEEGMSVYDALKILADNYDMPLKTSGIGQAVYVKGINGLMEYDYGGRSGWKYQVNGSYPSVGAGSYLLKDGDQVEWIYTTNG